MNKLLVISVLFLMLLLPAGFSQNIVENETGIENETVVEEITVEVTEGEALQAILDSEDDMQELIDAGLPATYVADKIIEMEVFFYGRNYTGPLESVKEKATGPERRAAVKAIMNETPHLLIGPARTNYARVLELRGVVIQRKFDAYNLYDTLILSEKEVERANESGVNITSALNILNKARAEFENDRFNASLDLTFQISDAIEEERAKTTRLAIIRASGATFLQKYWKRIIIYSAAISIAAILGFLWWQKKKIKDKLSYLKVEKKTIEKMIEKTQRGRFVNKGLSQSVYKVRMDQYRRRLERLKGEIPAYEKLVKGEKLSKEEREEIKLK